MFYQLPSYFFMQCFLLACYFSDILGYICSKNVVISSKRNKQKLTRCRLWNSPVKNSTIPYEDAIPLGKMEFRYEFQWSKCTLSAYSTVFRLSSFGNASRTVLTRKDFLTLLCLHKRAFQNDRVLTALPHNWAVLLPSFFANNWERFKTVIYLRLNNLSKQLSKDRQQDIAMLAGGSTDDLAFNKDFGLHKRFFFAICMVDFSSLWLIHTVSPSSTSMCADESMSHGFWDLFCKHYYN